jgi:hypothetical protein
LIRCGFHVRKTDLNYGCLYENLAMVGAVVFHGIPPQCKKPQKWKLHITLTYDDAYLTSKRLSRVSCFEVWTDTSQIQYKASISSTWLAWHLIKVIGLLY